MFYKSLPPGIRSFIEEQELCEKMGEIKNNTSAFDSFMKRFFGWFNMFKIVKYLNFVHPAIFEKRSVISAATDLLDARDLHPGSEDPVSLLHYFRSMERQ
jgi:hypothetical protein